MKISYALGTAMLSLALFVSSCKQNTVEGHGAIETETREAGAFTGLTIKAPVTAQVKIVAGAIPGISLKGYPNVLKEIKTEVKNGVLHIYHDDLIHIGRSEEVIAEITVPTLTSLTITGAADVNMEGPLSTSTFDLAVSGAGDIKMASINADAFNATLSGAGDLQVNGGSVNKLSYTVTGAGEIASFPLQSKEATVSVTGMGDVDLSVSGKLDASVTGAGDINYKGHPQLTTNITGAGSVQEAQ